jgi:hypothetical protein
MICRFVKHRGSQDFWTICTQMAVRLSSLRVGHVSVYLRAIVRLEISGKLKNSLTSSGNEPAAFRLVAFASNAVVSLRICLETRV